MSSSAAGPSGYSEPAGEGWVMFAGTMLAIVGTLNFIAGLVAVSQSSFFVGQHKFIVSNLNTWGWIVMVIGVIQVAVALGVWVRAKGVRWLGVAIAALNLLAQMFFLPAYPVWSLMMVVVDVLVIYGLVAHGSQLED